MTKRGNFRIDLRSLGLFRIFLSIALLWDLLLYKAGLFNVLLSPGHAMFPVGRMHELFGIRAASLFDLLGSPVSIHIFLVFCGLVYILLLVGYRSKWISVLAFFCFWNLAQRTSVFYNPAEMLTGSLLFLGMFLPLDRALAVRKSGSDAERTDLESPFSVLLLFQVALVYVMFALVRMEPELLTGKLLANYFSDMIYLKPRPKLGLWALKNGKIVLIGHILLCLAVPFGIFWKSRSDRARWIAIAIIGFLAMMKVYFAYPGNWFLVSLATMALLIPARTWRRTHLFGASTERSEAIGRTYSIWARAAALIIGLVLLHQNALTMAEREGTLSRLMKKTKITRILQITHLPRLEQASLFNQNWVRGMSTVPGRWGRFKVSGKNKSANHPGLTSTYRFRNYTSAGFAAWRNEMHKIDIVSLISNWARYESKADEGRQLAIFYENNPVQIAMMAMHHGWTISEWISPIKYYSYKGPVGQITGGYGARGPYAYRTMQKEHHGYPLMIYAPITDKPVPVVLFTHAFFGHNYQIYHSLMEHVASWGYAFAFVPYRKGKLNKDAEDRRIRYADVWEGFNDVMTDFPTVINPNRVVVAGHSYGGGAAASLAVKVFSETSWGNKAGGIAYFCPGYMEDIEQSELEALPGDLQLMVQVYQMDTVTDAGMARDFYDNAGIADSNKLFLVVEPDEVDGYTYLANHYVPLQIGPNQYYDAYDQYAVFRPFHAFLRSVFAKDRDAYEYLYNRETNAVVDMGPQLKPMRLMMDYEPLQEKDWYWAPCDHPGNPRREFCP